MFTISIQKGIVREYDPRIRIVHYRNNRTSVISFQFQLFGVVINFSTILQSV